VPLLFLPVSEELLSRMRLPVADEARQAADELSQLLYSPGSGPSPASVAALPALVAVAGDHAAHTRLEALELVALIVDDALAVVPEWTAPEWAMVWPALRNLLPDEEPGVRRLAAYLAGMTPAADDAVVALTARWPAEDDVPTRLDLISAVGQCAARGADPSWLWPLVDHGDPQFRLAAVMALGEAGLLTPADHLDTLVAAVRDPRADLWRDTAHLDAGRAAVANWASDALAGDRVANTALRLAIVESDDAGELVANLTEMADLLATSPAPARALVPVLTDRLSHEAVEVRHRAAHLLASCGEVAVPAADRLAALLADRTRRDPLAPSVAAVAAWGLTRMADPRGLPVLTATILAGEWGDTVLQIITHVSTVDEQRMLADLVDDLAKQQDPAGDGEFGGVR
jgi:hypothetical protein